MTGSIRLSKFCVVYPAFFIGKPRLGRFLSPDPYVQEPDFTQSFNRYAYCWNNPLKFTDPDGELVWLAPVIVGALIGGYSGYKIGKANEATGIKMAL
jgi:hypothetical protein